MKTKKILFTILMLVVLLSVSFAQEGLQKVFTTVVHPGESNMVFFDLPGEVEVKVWDRDYIKVEIDVATNLKNEEVLEYLKESGRYNIEKGYNTYYLMVLNIPNINEEVLVNRIALEESFKFRVTVPWDIDVDPGHNSNLTVGYHSMEKEGNILQVNQINQ